jgi:hypothetical protein
MERVPVRISDEFYRELCAIWLQELKNGRYPDGAIMERIRREFNITFMESMDNDERLFLDGRQCEDKVFEQRAGYLRALAPGVVIFLPDEDGCRRELFGLLERSGPSSTSLFVLRLFSQSCSDSLYIFPSNDSNYRRFKTCPVYIHWEFGAGMSDSYLSLGIDPGRWNNILKPWLDKWLPPESE